jgi:hypothetical protein
MKVIDGRWCVVSSSWVVIDLGLRIEYGNFDTQILRDEDSEQETRGAGSYDDNLVVLAICRSRHGGTYVIDLGHCDRFGLRHVNAVRVSSNRMSPFKMTCPSWWGCHIPAPKLLHGHRRETRLSCRCGEQVDCPT